MSLMPMTFDFSGMRACTQGSAALEMDFMSAVAAAPVTTRVTDGDPGTVCGATLPPGGTIKNNTC